MSKSITFLAAGILFLATLGCNSARETGQKVSPPPPEAKVTLEEIATSGSLSKKNQLRLELQNMSEARPGEAEELLNDFQQLLRETSPDAVKNKAREMAAKL